MTTPRDPDALLSAYLAVGMEVLPDRVVDAVLDEVHRTGQRAVFGPWRTRLASRTTLAAAVVVAVVALGGAFFVIERGQPAITSPGPTPSPSASPSLHAVVAPSSTPGATELLGPSTAPTPSLVAGPGGVWIATGTMGTPRTGHGAVRLLDGRVLVVGGSKDDTSDTSAELYDLASGTWSATGNMVHPKGGFPPTLLHDGRVLIGDVNDPDPTVDDDETVGAEVYDPSGGTWTATEKMVRGSGGVATLLRDGRVLVTGNDVFELYDPDTGTWSATGKMTTPRHSHVAILLPDGRVLVAGGHAPGDTPTAAAEVYDPETGSWTAIAKMHAPRDSIEAFLRPDGKVLVLGQSHRDGPVPAELYDPATGTWTATGDVPRQGISVDESTTMLSDGRVLMTNAPGDKPDAPPVAELYDPVAGSWTTTAPMLRPHGTPAILLLDGTVLVAGGRACQDGVCVATDSAELYVPAGVSAPPLPAFPSPAPPVIPSPTPRPTPYPPQAGPVPTGARTWSVTVVNRSAKPATLFLAEDDELTRLCGKVTPNVVPPDTTMKVTFLLPPKKVTSCWIYVNPVPGEGGSFFQTSDAPMKGQFLITADGQSMWGGA